MLSWVRNKQLISRILIIKLILAFGIVTFYPLEVDAAGRVRVRGYYRKDGTYVRPHYRSAPDGNPYNNYSFPGNYNPNTGRITPGNPQTYLDRYYNKSSSNSTRSYNSTRRNYNPKTRKISFGNFFKRFRLGERKPTSSTRQSPKSSFFTVGSTKSEVIAVQGTPDSSTETHLSYGLSIVYFRDGRVTSWKSYYPDLLKVK